MRNCLKRVRIAPAREKQLTLPAAALVGLLACARGGGDSVYTLVRSSAVDQGPFAELGRKPLRIHVTTFDAKDGEAFNAENCEIARQLFQAQPGVTVRFWCERGRFR